MIPNLPQTATQLYDQPNTDLILAPYVAFGEPTLRAAQFVVIDCPSGRRFLGSVAGPNRNYNRDSLPVHSSAAINQLESIQNGKMARDVAINEYYAYDIHLWRDISDGSAKSIRIRPQIASIARAATEEEIVRFLNLPEVRPDTTIGMLIDTEIPICLSRKVLNWHILVAGATGCGKTNVIANAITVARELGFFVLVLDHKPDYQNLHEVNDEGGSCNHYAGIPSFEYWHVGQPWKNNPYEQSIFVRPSELEPAMLAATILYEHSENQQREEFQSIIEDYSTSQTQWNIEELQQHVERIQPAAANINPATLRAIQRKLKRSARIPFWIDSRQCNPGTVRGRASNFQNFELERIVNPGHVAVLRVGGGAENGREYGLLLSYTLRKLDEYVANGSAPPILVVIDEAQDLFCADDSFKQVADAMLDRHIRKGRSKRIGYLIGVQSALAVPESIMQNLNSRIVLRHNGLDMVRTALTMATEEQRQMTNTFGPGEALVQMYGAIGIVHAQMRLSPFKLTKEEND